MSKKEKSVLLAGVGLLVLVVLLLVLVLTDDDSGNETPVTNTVSSGTSSEMSYTDVLIDTDVKTKSLKVENTKATFTLLEDETGEYYFDDIPELNLYEKFIVYLWDTTSYMGANQRITLSDGSDPTDFAEYGLDAPSCKVTITYDDGSSKYFEVGNQLPGSNGVYYVRVAGIEGIYAVTLHGGFFNDRLFFFDDAIVPMPQKADGTYEIITIDNITLSGSNYPQKLEIALNDEADNSYSAFYGSEFILTSPENVIPDATYFGNLVYQLKEVTVNKPLVFKPSDAELTQYGFDNPKAVVSYNYNGKDITLIAGKTDGTNTYLMMGGVDAIFVIQSSYISNWAEGNYELIRDASVFPRAFAAFKSFTITSVEGKAYDFRVVRQISDTKLTYDVTLNGKAIDISNYQKFISNMTLSQIVEYNLSPSDEAPAMKIEIDYFADSGLSHDTIEFISGGTRRYVCRINGKGNTAVSSTYIEKLLGDCEKLLNGENINLM